MTMTWALELGTGSVSEATKMTNPNTLIRSWPCAECGGEMLWTQNAWKTGDTGRAAYRCQNDHVLDPALTRQCPSCGIHDTLLLGENDGVQQFRCAHCEQGFQFPRDVVPGAAS